MRNSIFTLTYSLLTIFLVFAYVQIHTTKVSSENSVFLENSDESTEEIDFEEKCIDFRDFFDENDLISHFDVINSPNNFYYSFTVKSNHIALNAPPPRFLFA